MAKNSIGTQKGIRYREKYREYCRNLGHSARKSKIDTFVAPYQSNMHQTVCFLFLKKVFFQVTTKSSILSIDMLKKQIWEPYMENSFSVIFTKFN